MFHVFPAKKCNIQIFLKKSINSPHLIFDIFSNQLNMFYTLNITKCDLINYFDVSVEMIDIFFSRGPNITANIFYANRFLYVLMKKSRLIYVGNTRLLFFVVHIFLSGK